MDRFQIVSELHKPARKNFARRCVKIKGLDDLWQADLVEMIPYANENNGYKYLLTIIDTFSKFTWVEPLKKKESKIIVDAFKKVFSQNKRMPKNLQTDMGTEFFNKDFNKLMKQKNINHYSSFSPLKASIIERFNRTLKEHMWKMFSLQGTYKWVNILENLVKDYNHKKHRTINLAPVKVTKKNENQILKDIYSPTPRIIKQTKFHVDDFVRVSKFKTVFEKGYTPNWTTEIFKVVKVNNKFPVTYLLKDYQGNIIAGRFYEQELQKTNYPDTYLVEKIMKKKNNKAYVKWLGFSSSHNTWINEKDIL